jgi:hypothetical protein
MSGGKRLPNAAYAVNGAYVADSTATIADEGTIIPYIIKNDGTRPPYVTLFGFGQLQDPSAEAMSIIGNVVNVRPGAGSSRKEVSFQFTTVSNEDTDPPTYQPLTGDGTINEDGFLVPNGLEGQDILIQFVGRDVQGPPTWLIGVGESWYSTDDTKGTTRLTIIIQLGKKINSVVSAAKALGAGAKVYKYSEKVGKFSRK